MEGALGMHGIMDIFTKEKTDKVRTITTLEIAEMMEVEHWQVLRKLEGQEREGKHIKGYVEILNDNNIVVVDYFIKSSYVDAKGEQRPCYNVTKLGCDFLANKFTGEKGILFTARYVKRFDEMENQIKREEKPSLESINRAADILKEAYQAAGTDERYLALLVGSVYKECGMEFSLPPVKMDVDNLYDQTMIANELGVMSISGKPHAQAIGAIINLIDVPDEDKISTPYTNHGHSGVATQYTKNVVEMVQGWIYDHGKPKRIDGDGKTFQVNYI